MKGQLLTAAVLCAAVLAQPLTAAAAYESAEEIKLAVRPMQTAEGMYHPEGSQTLYVSPAAAVSGAQMHVGVFIEAERAELNMIVFELETGSESLTFIPDTFRNPKMDMAEEASTYTLPDGTTFESQYLPYCLGKVTEKGLYKPACYSMMHNFPEDCRSFNVIWQYGFYSEEDVNATAFLGGDPDAFSFVEMDMQLAAGTAPGSYQIGFNATDSVLENANKSHTIITSYEGTLSKSAYADLVPGLKPLDIIVGAAQLDGDAEVFRFADETAAPSPADLTGTVSRLQDGTLAAASLTEECFTYAEAPGFPDVVTVPEVSDAALLCDGLPVLTAEGKPVTVSYRIGCRGDVDLDGAVTASDAARILIYAAQKGAGEEAALTDAENEAFAEFLGDVNGNGTTPELNASDAAFVLIYAAVNGSGNTPDWQKILHPDASSD
ncbi:MAG: dockerin type I repeat-containing protein [Oscillospiraceae bacterium]|nr:dockerin type I repeat-containing protein [Oscillospiraceae bacterium]